MTYMIFCSNFVLNSLANIEAKNISCEQTEQTEYNQFAFSASLVGFPYTQTNEITVMSYLLNVEPLG